MGGIYGASSHAPAATPPLPVPGLPPAAFQLCGTMGSVDPGPGAGGSVDSHAPRGPRCPRVRGSVLSRSQPPLAAVC